VCYFHLLLCVLHYISYIIQLHGMQEAMLSVAGPLPCPTIYYLLLRCWWMEQEERTITGW
jgi:hypothetical protein